MLDRLDLPDSMQIDDLYKIAGGGHSANTADDPHKQLFSIGQYIDQLHTQIASLADVATAAERAHLELKSQTHNISELRQQMQHKDGTIHELHRRVGELEEKLHGSRSSHESKQHGLAVVLQQNDTLTKQLRLMTTEIESIMKQRQVNESAQLGHRGDDY
eukprot:SAG31_NODE_988_length_10542_cov_52.848319_12_plen_160_part_00